MTFLISVINIIIIDIVLSGDNALIIGMAVKNLPDVLRKKAIFRGTICATIMRIIFSMLAVYLLQIVGLKLLGGGMLMYIVWKFYKNLRLGEMTQHHVLADQSLMSAVWVIVVADVLLSLDNVLSVAGVAHGNWTILGFGLLLSVMLMAIASTYIAKILDKYPRIQRLGLLIILYVGCDMLLGGSEELEQKIFHFNIVPYVIGLTMLGHMWLHDRFIITGDETKLKNFLSHHYFEILSVLLVMIVLFVVFGPEIHRFVWMHQAIGLTAVVILLGCALELILLKGGWRRFLLGKKALFHHPKN